MGETLDTLEIKIKDSSSTASAPLTSLATALTALRKASSGSTAGLTKIATGIESIAKASNSINSSSASNLTALADGIKSLQSISSIKISSTIATNITRLSESMAEIKWTDGDKLTTLADGLTSLSTLGKSNLTSFITQLGKLPDLIDKLDNTDLDKFKVQLQELSDAIAPLAAQMNTVATSFSAFPSKIQSTITGLGRYNAIANSSTTSTNAFAFSLTTLIAKVYILKRVLDALGGAVAKSNEYQENLNLFTASMGQYTEEAMDYAETVSEIMGIDVSAWIRNQGVFMTLATGFGVANEQAYIMSKNLTQLGYDISSFYNTSVEDAMQKLQSGISGELEPLRRLGYDLSQARLEQEALNLGIEQSVADMTQAEKSQLRYIAIMTQVTQVQGDMSRTLEAPANQLRILQAQLDMAARAIGNIFIPALNAILPYAIAVVQAIREIANAVASLFGFEITEVDYSGLEMAAGDTEDLASGMEDAASAAKDLAKYTLGFDELNVLDASTSSGTSTDDLSGSGFEFELPEYDFLGDAISGRLDGITEAWKPVVDKIKEDITKLFAFVDDNLDQILTMVGIVGTAFLAWKLSTAFITGISSLYAMLTAVGTKSLILNVALGLTLAGAGIAMFVDGIKNALKDGLQEIDLFEMLVGGITGTAGIALLGKTVAGWITKTFAGSTIATALTTAASNLGLATASAAGAALAAAASGIIFGIPAFITGIYDSMVNGIDWLSASLTAAGATAAGAGIGAIIGAMGGPIGAGIGALIGLAVGALTDLGITVYQNWEEIVTWFTGNVIEPISTMFSNLWDRIKNTSVGTWFSELFQSMKVGFKEVANIASQTWTNIKTVWRLAVSWFETTVTAPLMSKFNAVWTYVSDQAISAWTTIKTAWSEIGDWFETNIALPIEKCFDIAMDYIRGLLNKLIDWVNAQLKFDFDGLSIMGQEIIPAFSFQLFTLPSIPEFADGGFPTTGELFIAREAGAEMVGSMGGKTTVANNDQIVAGIKVGVYEAVVAAMSATIGNGNETITLNVTTELDGQVVYANQEKVKRQRGATIVSGAFAR